MYLRNSNAWRKTRQSGSCRELKVRLYSLHEHEPFNLPALADSRPLIAATLWLHDPRRHAPSNICRLVDACIANMPLNVTTRLSSRWCNERSLTVRSGLFYFRLNGDRREKPPRIPAGLKLLLFFFSILFHSYTERIFTTCQRLQINKL